MVNNDGQKWWSNMMIKHGDQNDDQKRCSKMMIKNDGHKLW